MTSDDEPRDLPEDHLRQSPEGSQPPQYPTQPGPPPPSNPYDPQQGQPYTQPYTQPYGQPYGQQPAYGGPPGPPVAPAHPSATTAMVLGLVGLAGIMLCGGLTLVLSPFAWVMGARAVKEIDAAPGRYSGRDQAQGGRIMGIIGTVLLMLGVLAVIALLTFAFALRGEMGSPGPTGPGEF